MHDHHQLPPAWQRFVEQCETCRQCSLGQTRRQAVIWRGALAAPLMFIGEGPGAEEDAGANPLSAPPAGCWICCFSRMAWTSLFTISGISSNAGRRKTGRRPRKKQGPAVRCWPASSISSNRGSLSF